MVHYREYLAPKAKPVAIKRFYMAVLTFLSQVVSIFNRQTLAGLKGAQSRLNGLKSLTKLFKIRCLQSVSIFSILNHPCSIMVYYYLFDVFLCL